MVRKSKFCFFLAAILKLSIMTIIKPFQSEIINKLLKSNLTCDTSIGDNSLRGYIWGIPGKKLLEHGK